MTEPSLTAAISSLLTNAEKEFNNAGSEELTSVMRQTHLIVGMVCRCLAESLIAARNEETAL